VQALAWPVSFYITTRMKLSNKIAKRFEETYKVKRRLKIVKRGINWLNCPLIANQ